MRQSSLILMALNKNYYCQGSAGGSPSEFPVQMVSGVRLILRASSLECPALGLSELELLGHLSLSVLSMKSLHPHSCRIVMARQCSIV